MFKFVNQHLKKQKYKFLIFIILSYILNSIFLISPLITGKMFDILSTELSFSILSTYIKIFAFLQISSIIINYFLYKLNIYIQTKITFSINCIVVQHFQNVILNQINDLDTVYVNQRINHDSNNIAAFTINAYTNIGIQAIIVILSTLYLLKTNNKIALFLILIILFYILLYAIFKKKLYEMSLLFKEAQSKFFGTLNEQLENIYFLQIHSMRRMFIEKLLKHFDTFFNKIIFSQRFFYFYQSLDSVITTITQICIYLFGGLNVINGQIKIGEFTIITSYFQYILSGVTYFSDLAKNYQDTLTSYNRLKEYIELPSLKNGEVYIPKIKSITLQNLSFSRGDKKILDSIDYCFSVGNIYGITGENGSGKSTLINLLLGLNPYEYSGEIFYNDINIKNLDMNRIRLHNISVIEQFPYIFDGTVSENIFLGPEYDTNYIHDFFNLPSLKTLKMDQTIYKDGHTLSGGEKQKIALLRLFAKNTELLVLDEPTNFLDTSTVKFLKKYLISQKSNKIIIISSHNKEMKEIFDFILPL